MPKNICVEASQHPTVCNGIGGVKLVKQLDVGYCKAFVPELPIDKPDGCIKYDSINVAWAVCYPAYHSDMNGPDCWGTPNDIYCRLSSANMGPQWICLPDYNNLKK